jgi:hypothetical protein
MTWRIHWTEFAPSAISSPSLFSAQCHENGKTRSRETTSWFVIVPFVLPDPPFGSPPAFLVVEKINRTQPGSVLPQQFKAVCLRLLQSADDRLSLYRRFAFFFFFGDDCVSSFTLLHVHLYISLVFFFFFFFFFLSFFNTTDR